MSLVCVACGAENLGNSSSTDVSAICRYCGNSLITAKESPVCLTPPNANNVNKDLTIQELIIRAVQFCVCYLAASGMSFMSVVFCVRDGGHDSGNIVAIMLLFGIPVIGNVTFAFAFWLFKKSAFNLRCFYSMLVGTGLTWIIAIIAGGIRQLFNI